MAWHCADAASGFALGGDVGDAGGRAVAGLLAIVRMCMRKVVPIRCRLCTAVASELGAPMAAAQVFRRLLQADVPGDVLIFMPGGYEMGHGRRVSAFANGVGIVDTSSVW